MTTDCGINDQCSNHGVCVSHGDQKFCQCEHNYSSKLACSTCKDGHLELSDVCYPNECKNQCSQFGNCVFKNQKFSCQCIANHSEGSQCSKCVGNFDIQQRCLACKQSYVQQGDVCVHEQLSGKEYAIIICGTIGLCILVAIALFIYQQMQKQKKLMQK